MNVDLWRSIRSHVGGIRDATAASAWNRLHTLCGRLAGLTNYQRIQALLRAQRRTFQAAATDIFVVSFPKSGTTWMQRILHELLRPGVGFQHLNEVQGYYDREVVALGGQRFGRLPSPRIFKSHLPSSLVPLGPRIVYMIRDVRDVAVSLFHHLQDFEGRTVKMEQFLDEFLQHGFGVPRWDQHVVGWLSAPRPILVISYEGLLSDTVATIRQVATFFGLDNALERAQQAAVACSFAEMKRAEHQYIPHAPRPGGRFFRKGRTGSWQEELTAGQAARLQGLARSAASALGGRTGGSVSGRDLLQTYCHDVQLWNGRAANSLQPAPERAHLPQPRA
jgi:hypothetical protein